MQTQEQDAEQRIALADAIESRIEDIVTRWLDQLRADARAAEYSLTELRDGIHDYLRLLADLLRKSDSIDQIGAEAWADVAREHAITRVRLGFDVSQLFHELVAVRRVASEVLREQGLIDHSTQFERLVDLTEAAMGASIKSYVDFRDYASRRAEAEHIGFLTHELRNPLAAATMAAKQLHDRHVGEVARKRLHDILDRNLDRLRHLIDDTLLTEKLEIGEADIRPIDTTLGQLVGGSIEIFKRNAREKGLKPITSYDPAATLRADPSLTLSALEHLLENAIKYTDRGIVDLRIEETEDEVVFHVRDNCDGLSPEELRIIFEPFKRAHSHKPGTGLGLAIARRAVEVQGGKIFVESKTEHGCHFWFTLPKTHH